MKFEEALRRLEAVVEKLEQGDDNLDDLLRLYEEGVKLVDECSLRLSEVETRFEELQRQLDKDVEQIEQDTVDSPKE